MSLEVLNGFFVFLGRRFCTERAEIPSFTGSRILLPRIQPVLTRLKFSNHRVFSLLIGHRRLVRRNNCGSEKKRSDTRFGARESSVVNLIRHSDASYTNDASCGCIAAEDLDSKYARAKPAWPVSA